MPQGRGQAGRKRARQAPGGFDTGHGVRGIAIRHNAVEGEPTDAMRPVGNSGVPLKASGVWRRAAVCAVLLVLLPFAAGAADIRVLTVADGLPSNWVTALAAAPDGKLWVGTGDAGLYELDLATGKGKGYRTADGVSSDAVTSIALFQGKVYAGTAAGLSVFDGSGWESIHKVENVTMRSVRVAASPDGKQLWACSVYLAGGTVRFDGNSWKFMGGKGRGLFNNVTAFAFPSGGVLLGTVSGGAYLHKGSDVLVLKEGLLPMNAFSAAAVGNRTFLGTSRGLLAWDGTRWNEVPLPGGFARQPVFSLAASGNDLLVAGAGGVARLSGNKYAVLTAMSGLPRGKIKALAVGGDYVAAGSPSGLAIIRNW